jgi:hypothetical protein
MKHDADNHFHIRQCPCCGQGICEREFFDISETLQRDTLRYLYKRIAELEERNSELEEKLKIVLLV